MPLRLSEYARQNGISYRTAWRAFKAGKLTNARQLPSGAIVVDEKETLEMGLKEVENQLKTLSGKIENISCSLNELSKNLEEIKIRVEKGPSK